MVNQIEYLGWTSSFILALTLGKQIHKQWKTGSSEGVSKWLYLGQFAAELGFILYSYLVKNWVFFVTNLVLLLENILGLGITFYHRKKSPTA